MMEWAIAVCICLCVGSAIVCVLCAKQCNKSADVAVEFAESAELDANSAQSGAGRVKAMAAACVEAVDNFKKASQEVLAAVRAEGQVASGQAVSAETSANAAAEMAEVVKVESAKLVTMIEKLNKVRAGHPPLVAVVHSAETGEAERVGTEGAYRKLGRHEFGIGRPTIREDHEV